MAETKRFVRIVAKHFVCGIVLERERCVEAAPIMRWAVGKPWSEIKQWKQIKEWQES